MGTPHELFAQRVEDMPSVERPAARDGGMADACPQDQRAGPARVGGTVGIDSAVPAVKPGQVLGRKQVRIPFRIFNSLNDRSFL